MNFVDQFKAARLVSTPLIEVVTPDPAAAIAQLMEVTEKTPRFKGAPIMIWDIVRGLSGANEAGVLAVSKVMNGEDPSMLTNPVEALSKFAKPGALDGKAIIFFFAHQRYLDEPAVAQAIWNLRDVLKASSSSNASISLGTLVLISQVGLTLPPQLSSDVLVLDEPLPTPEQLRDIIKEIYSAASLSAPSDEGMSKALDAICGLAAFPAEQVLAMSISKTGLDLDALWERKRQQIEQTPGLSVWRGGEKFADIGGCENIKKFSSRVLAGEANPRAIVFIDEIEKALAGAGGDLSGTSQEMLGTLLSFMQDKSAAGLLFIGPPGAAKSAMAKAMGNEGGIPTISFDISGMKGSLVGESGKNMRVALKLVESVAQQRALFVATCNSIGVLPPELRRRFSFGTFFFDLPDREERAAIWNIYVKKYSIKANDARPDDSGWTGAEIKQCCDLAWRLKTTLKDASTYIVPVSKSAADQIEKLRRDAAGRFISASHPGVYQQRVELPAAPSKSTRAVGVEQ